MSDLFDKVLSKTNLWADISIGIFLISFLSVPENNLELFLTGIIIFSVFLSFILEKICNIESLWKLLFLKQLADIEFNNRKFTENPSFFDLQKDAKEEVNKLDEHIKEFFLEYMEILMLFFINCLILLLLLFKVIPLITFTFFSLSINNLLLIFLVLLLNILFLYNAKSQIVKDFSMYKEIYKKYGKLRNLSLQGED
ncbi:MAG: hypothetical protein OIN86_07400 [Candidatus Methanoperedens sp.]|nr:hypothetical protein [Candidatus Methanoperedens sp.]CAG0987771.1 hypothetical protein METP1_02127 [Methanosarcinales archaeon]